MSDYAKNEQDKLAKQRRILESAKSLFFEYGYQQTSIHKIMKTTGESTGTFYQYFKSKREIYVKLYTDGLDIFKSMLEDALQVCGPTALAQLVAVAKVYLMFYRRYPGYFDIVAFLVMNDQELRNRDEGSDELDQKAISILKEIEKILIGGIARNELKPTNTWIMTITLWGVMDGIIMLEKRGNLPTMGTSMDQVFDQTIKSFVYQLALE